jgi:predicted nucleic acid-binding protein
MNALIDTNVLLRSAEPTDPDYRAATDAVAALRVRGGAPTLVPQNFYEYWVVSTRPLANNGRGRTPAQVAFMGDTPAVFTEWERLVTAHGVTGKPAHDARLVAAMLAHGVTHLLTFNGQDFARYPGIVVLDPAQVAVPPPPPTTPLAPPSP